MAIVQRKAVRHPPRQCVTTSLSHDAKGRRNLGAEGVNKWNVNKGLDKVFIDSLQPYAGFRVSATGSFGLMTGHTMGSPMFVTSSISRFS